MYQITNVIWYDCDIDDTRLAISFLPLLAFLASALGHGGHPFLPLSGTRSETMARRHSQIIAPRSVVRHSPHLRISTPTRRSSRGLNAGGRQGIAVIWYIRLNRRNANKTPYRQRAASQRVNAMTTPVIALLDNDRAFLTPY